MKRALILNSGLSWTAYQIGVLRHLVIDQALHFDICAGTGIGAVSAAFVACGEFVALETFWKQIGLRQLGSFNWRTPWQGLFTGAPQRRFIAAHIHEEKLAARGGTLLVSTMNLQTGREQVMTYPGSDLPLEDALMAAIATCGLFPPVLYQHQQLADATFINSFMLPTVLQQPIEEVIAVAVAIQRGVHSQRRYKTWPAIFERALYMNLAHDVRGALDEGERVSGAAEAFRHVSSQLPARLGEHITNAAQREQLLHKVSGIYCNSSYPLKRTKGPLIKIITPSRDLDYPLWRFRSRDLASAKALGYQDARVVIGREGDRQ
jgi:predicted acylesterase/phospholipase RssA